MATQESLPPLSATEQSEVKASKLAGAARLGAATVAMGFQQSPGNEAARAYIGASLLETTHNPLVAGAGIGLTTLAIEGTSGLSVAVAMHHNKESWKSLMNRLRNGRITGIFMRQDNQALEQDKSTDVALALTVGAGAVVARRYSQEQERSAKDDRHTIAKAAGGIAVFSAGLGSLAAGGIEYAEKVGLEKPAEVSLDVLTDWRSYALALGGLVVYKGSRNAVHNIRSKLNKYSRLPSSYEYGRITDAESIRKALELEQRVWEEEEYESYGSIKDYEKYLPQTRLFAVFDQETGECVGSTRQFAGRPELPPFLALKKDGKEVLPITDPDQRAKLVEGCRTGEVEEFGTVAVDKSLRNGNIFLSLCRMAYRDAYKRGIKTWGIIMEPERVAKMNERLHFCFEQLGEPEMYQGGMCAIHTLDLERVRSHMKSRNPELFDWFVNQPFSEPLPLRALLKKPSSSENQAA